MAHGTKILVETTKAQKDALAATLREQGSTLTEWFNDNLASATMCFDSAMQGDELECLENLSDSTATLARLADLDWSFSDEDTGYLSHDIHPYPAKFIPQLPRNIIAQLSLRGELVWDPFGGSGTTALESILMGRQAMSSDLNPLAEVIGKAKLLTLTKEEDGILRAFAENIQITASNEASVQAALERSAAQTAPFVPEIPNLAHWFHPQSTRELSFLRWRISELVPPNCKILANVCLSKIILKASFQDGETRYARCVREFPMGKVLTMFSNTLDSALKKVRTLGTLLKFRSATFKTADLRVQKVCEPNSVDLIVTSPPYPNATDYHLYHRFRLFWLGFDPRELAHKEIGSHLRHQKESNGIEHYLQEMGACLGRMLEALRPGRFAVLIIGDALFKGETSKTSTMVGQIAAKLGFECLGEIDRQLPSHKRSFIPTARRLRLEQLLVLRKPLVPLSVQIHAPPYRLWPYESAIRHKEIEKLLNVTPKEQKNGTLSLEVSPLKIDKLRRLTFSHSFEGAGLNREPTWQAILENGDALNIGARKDPKYVTHGIHPYKGKFYPQLARSLFNLANLRPGQRVLDPFCGSGTVPLEAHLNGMEGCGFDMNPLAVKVATSKTQIVLVDPYLRDRLLHQFQQRLGTLHSKSVDWSVFPDEARGEIESWFPQKVIRKISVLLREIRTIPEVRVQEFLEVLLSSIVREVSQQDPEDLRIRRRAEPIEDAPVFELFGERLEEQSRRLISFAQRANKAPCKFIEARIQRGDSREAESFKDIISKGGIDAVVTSPPYATALPYIDTDRLSILLLCGIPSSTRSDIEEKLTGSREIRNGSRRDFELKIQSLEFPEIHSTTAIKTVSKVYNLNKDAEVGFRRKNMAALLYRYFEDMSKVMRNMDKCLKPGASAFFVIGDNVTTAGEQAVTIQSSKFIQETAVSLGWSVEDIIPITVTKEKRPHSKNSITDNDILWFRKTGA